MKKDKINILRANINDLDNQILKLLDSRSLLVKEIGKSKGSTKAIIDKERENAILIRLLKRLKGNYSKDSDCMEGNTCRKTFSGFDVLTLLDADGRFCIFTYDEIKNSKHSVHHKGGTINPNTSQAIIDGM